jgi:hypothetical protein
VKGPRRHGPEAGQAKKKQGTGNPGAFLLAETNQSLAQKNKALSAIKTVAEAQLTNATIARWNC